MKKSIVIQMMAILLAPCVLPLSAQLPSTYTVTNDEELVKEVHQRWVADIEWKYVAGNTCPFRCYLIDNPGSIAVLRKSMTDEQWYKFISSCGGFVRTREADKEIGGSFAQKAPLSFDNPSKIKLALVASSLGSTSLGMEGTYALIEKAEKDYPSPSWEELFRNYPPFTAKYLKFIEAVKNNIALFNELEKITEDDMEGWDIWVMSYASDKLGGNSSGLEGIIEARSHEQAMSQFLSDFLATYQSDNTDKELVSRDGVDQLLALFKTLAARGGRYDFQSEKTVKQIVVYNNWYERRYYPTGAGSHFLTEEDRNAYGLMSVQSVIADNKGKIRYFFTFNNGKWDKDTIESQRSKIFLDPNYCAPWTFFLSKVVYDDKGNPVDLISTEIYADEEIKRLLNSAVRCKYPMDFMRLGKRGKAVSCYDTGSYPQYGFDGVSDNTCYPLKGFDYADKLDEVYMLSYEFRRRIGWPIGRTLETEETEVNTATRRWMMIGTELLP